MISQYLKDAKENGYMISKGQTTEKATHIPGYHSS